MSVWRVQGESGEFGMSLGVSLGLVWGESRVSVGRVSSGKRWRPSHFSFQFEPLWLQEGKAYPVHRFILAACSDELKTRLCKQPLKRKVFLYGGCQLPVWIEVQC